MELVVDLEEFLSGGPIPTDPRLASVPVPDDPVRRRSPRRFLHQEAVRRDLDPVRARNPVPRGGAALEFDRDESAVGKLSKLVGTAGDPESSRTKEGPRAGSLVDRDQRAIPRFPAPQGEGSGPDEQSDRPPEDQTGCLEAV